MTLRESCELNYLYLIMLIKVFSRLLFVAGVAFICRVRANHCGIIASFCLT